MTRSSANVRRVMQEGHDHFAFLRIIINTESFDDNQGGILYDKHAVTISGQLEVAVCKGKPTGVSSFLS